MTWQRTKIVCTLGPATDPPGVLAAMVRGGMNVARINFSHGTEDDHARRIQQVREVSRNSDEPVALLADLPGPKFRLGNIADGSSHLADGSRVYLAKGDTGAGTLPIRHPGLLAALQPGHNVYLADGAVELRVVAATADRVECEVIAGGTVRSGSGVNVPDADLPGLVPTEQDRVHLAFAASHGVDWIGVSFVQRATDLTRVRECLRDTAAPLLIAKIEKRRAVASLDEIVDAADGIMVARGDLGVETDLAEIPLVQKRIIAAANARARPVITATQMLESMVEHDRPTRAEVTDVANAVLDGTDAVMLSAESAVGRNPVAAVNILRRVIAATESEYAPHLSAVKLQTTAVGPGDAVAFAACQLAKRLDARAIITNVCLASQAAALAQFRPAPPIVAFAQTENLRHALALVSSVSPLVASNGDTAETRLHRVAQWLYSRAMAQPGECVVVLSSATPDAKPDTLSVAYLPRRA